MARDKYQATYTQEAVDKAIQRIREGKSISEASRTYSIPKTTLLNKVSGRTPIQVKLGKNPYLTDAEERRISTWVQQMARIGFCHTRREMKQVVKRMLEKDGRPNPFIDNLPGDKWFSLFMRRHPELSPQILQNIEVTTANVEGWYDKFEAYLKNFNAASILTQGHRMFNCDELSFPLRGKMERVHAPAGFKTVGSLNMCNRKQITVLCTVSAAGGFLPPTIVYAGSKLEGNPLEGGPSGANFGRSSKGWIHSKVFCCYISNCFLPYLTRQGIERPVVLLVGGHACYLSLEVAELCQENDIILYCLPSYSSHELQPDDLSVFCPLKGALRTAEDMYVMLHEGKVVSKMTFAQAFKPVWEEVSSKPEIVQNGFRAAGLFPFTKVCDKEKLTAAVVNLPAPTSGTACLVLNHIGQGIAILSGLSADRASPYHEDYLSPILEEEGTSMTSPQIQRKTTRKRQATEKISKFISSKTLSNNKRAKFHQKEDTEGKNQTNTKKTENQLRKNEQRKTVKRMKEQRSPLSETTSAARNKYRATYTQEAVDEAIQRIQMDGMSVNRASKTYGIPKTTLLDKVSGRTPIQAKIGGNRYLTDAEEERIATWVQQMAQIGCGHTRQGLKQFVKEMLEKDGRPNPFKDDLPGNKWLNLFMRRHPELSPKMPQDPTLCIPVSTPDATCSLPNPIPTPSHESSHTTEPITTSQTTVVAGHQDPSNLPGLPEDPEVYLSPIVEEEATSSQIPTQKRQATEKISKTFSKNMRVKLHQKEEMERKIQKKTKKTTKTKRTTEKIPKHISSKTVKNDKREKLHQKKEKEKKKQKKTKETEKKWKKKLKRNKEQRSPLRGATTSARKYRATYTQEAVHEAIQCIREGKSVCEASRIYGIPKTTLMDKVSGRAPIETKLGKSPYLTDAEERRVSFWVQQMALIGCGYTKQELKQFVKRILDKDDRPNPFKDNLPGDKWVNLFMGRHPELQNPATSDPATTSGSTGPGRNTKLYEKKEKERKKQKKTKTQTVKQQREKEQRKKLKRKEQKKKKGKEKKITKNKHQNICEGCGRKCAYC